MSEIIRMPPITKMPNTPPYAEGIINLRGKVIPIISIRKRFGLMDSEHTSHTRIMVMEVAGGMSGFIVDSVSEVIRIHGGDIQPPPSVSTSGGIDQDFISGVCNHGERLLVIMDVERMFSHEEQQLIPIPNQSAIFVGSSKAPQRTTCTPSSPSSSPT